MKPAAMGVPFEFLGYYDPMKNPADVKLDVEKDQGMA